MWHPTADGRDPTTEALDAIVAEQPLRVLEVGPGTGAFAARVAAALPGVRLTAIDQSAHFVELSRARGVDAREGDAQDLPFGDESFDVVAALWMLYHVPDVDRAIAESAGCSARAACSWPSPTATTTSPTSAGRRAASPGHRLQHPERRGQLRAHFADVQRAISGPRRLRRQRMAESYLQSSGEDVDWRVPRSTSPASTPARPRSSAAADPLPPGSAIGQRQLLGRPTPVTSEDSASGDQEAVSTALWVTGFDTLPARSVAVARTKSVPLRRPVSRTTQAPFADGSTTAAFARFHALPLVAALAQVLLVALKKYQPWRASRSPRRRRSRRRALVVGRLTEDLLPRAHLVGDALLGQQQLDERSTVSAWTVTASAGTERCCPRRP